VVDSGWQPLGHGLEWRTTPARDSAGQVVDIMTAVRIDPTIWRLTVQYDPANPRTVQDWAAHTGAAIVLNAGFFTPEYQATGLIIADGHAYGSSYLGFGGMLAIDSASAQLHWLPERPYDPAENLLGAVQSFPMLVTRQGVSGVSQDDGIPARRTVVGQDAAGRILMLVFPSGGYTLHQLAQYLVSADLDLVRALNLDGGTSCGMAITDPGADRVIPSGKPVPAVILVDKHP
jgi:uncharacterized protein YigE (DUF2233 family)